MAEGLVNFLLKKINQEENNLSPSVREDADFIADELEFMKAFFRATDAMEDQENDFFPKSWLKKVRDVVYDMEDAIDEFKVNLAHDNYNHGHRYHARLQKIACCINTSEINIQLIASRMQEIKSRVINISQIQRRYLIKNKIMEKGLSSTIAAAPHLPNQQDTLVLEDKEADLVGIDWPKACLIEWLVTGKSDRQIVSVVGVEGLGKSTLVKRVFDDAEVKKHFKFRAWITISQSFKIEDLLKDLIQQLVRVGKISNPLDVVGKDKIKLKTVINQFLRQKRYLIVLDNVWDTNSFDAFASTLHNNNCGSRILLTTSNLLVSSMNSPDKVYNLTPLSREDSWSLFCNKVFHNYSCPPQFKKVTKKILSKCEGLPLAIVAVSGLLATKDNSRIDRWEMIHRALDDRMQHGDKMLNVRKILLLSYNDLPYYLKSCLLYFSIFPEGYPIKCTRLIRLWIAEGFVNEQAGMTLEEVAEGYLNELTNRNLVQVVEATIERRAKRCLIHDLLRELLISKAVDQEFITIVNKKSITWPGKVRRVSIFNPTQTQQLPSRLRSLLMFWGVDSLSESSMFNLSFNRLRLLNVLDLEGSALKEFPNEIVNLSLLKYLSLKNTKVNSIPKSIGKLQNLETLDLKHAHVTELPAEILKLQKLRHLLVYRYEISYDDEIHTKHGFKAPTQIGSLQFVQKLCFLEANQDRNLMLELGRLSHLRRLGLVKLRKEDGKALCSSIEKLTKLRALSITSMSETEVINIENLSSPPQFLQRLYLAGCLEKIPTWVCSLDSLVKVVLKWSQLSDDPLLSLQDLPNLVHLELVQAYDGKELYFQRNGFQSLKYLGLNKLQKLEQVNVEKGAMPCLEKLVIQSCHSLQTVPLGIQHLLCLNVLEFINMPIDLIMELNHGNHRKVDHVPEVHFSYFNNGNWDTFSLNGSRKEKNSAYILHKLISHNI